MELREYFVGFLIAKISKDLAFHGCAILGEDIALLGDGLGGVEKVSCHHTDSNSGILAGTHSTLDIGTEGILMENELVFLRV